MLSKSKLAESKRPYSTSDIAKEFGIRSPAVVRRILRAAAIEKPDGGWSWADKTAAKDALGAVQRAQTPGSTKTK